MIYCLSDLLYHQRDNRLSHIAVVDGERRLTYAELIHRTEQFAALLQVRGYNEATMLPFTCSAPLNLLLLFLPCGLLAPLSLLSMMF